MTTMTITLDTRIDSVEVAKAFLNEFYPTNVNDDNTVTISRACTRCGGSGYGGWVVDGGRCFACHGANTKNHKTNVCVKKYAQSKKQSLKKQEKAKQARIERAEASLERQRDWCEANTEFGRVTFDEKAALIKEQRDAEKQLADDVPTGRMEVTGEVLKVDWKENAYGGRLVMTVKTEGGYLLWGSVPRGITDVDNPDGTRRQLDRGDKVKFTATLEQSDRDTKFGFFKRPSKATVV